MNNKGFTKVQFFITILVLGVIILISIPNISKYVKEAKKQDIINVIDKYIEKAKEEVNSNKYDFSDNRYIYALPINCLSIKEDINPFKDFDEPSSIEWAYVLIEHDLDDSYIYGFTFRNTEGYGLLPAEKSKIDRKLIRDIKSQKELKSGYLNDYTEEWPGFKTDINTRIKVIKIISNNEKSDDIYTCKIK